jgi:hypothetical protein
MLPIGRIRPFEITYSKCRIPIGIARRQGQRIEINAIVMGSTKKILFNAALMVFSIVALLLSIEWATRLIHRNNFTNGRKFRETRPAPYRDSEYFSDRFIDESYRQPGKWINVPGTRIIYPDNFKGEYFNVENNLRRTTDSPRVYSNRIFLFGGSTVYCSEVPDEHTIASYLQRLVNASHPERYRVVNCGVSSINTVQQLEKMNALKYTAGDIVCFYGGVNDALLFVTGRVNGWIMGENYVEYSKKFNLLQKIRYRIYNSFRFQSRFVDIYLYPFSNEVPTPMQDTANISVLQRELMKSYEQSLKSADSTCQTQGVTFYNFLQPHIFTRKTNTGFEKALKNNFRLIPISSMHALNHGYQVLTEASRRMQESGMNSIDLASAFDGTDDDYYLDNCHITEKGNEIIASEIFKNIKLD